MNEHQPAVQMPTPYHDLNRVLHELVNAQADALGSDFVGAYLQGSFAVGDFDLHSDVDLAVVVENELTEGQVGKLQMVHGRVHGMNSRWAGHLEGSYFPKHVIRSPEGLGKELWYLDNGARELIRSQHCNTLVVRYTVREQGVTLAGPPPATLVDQVLPDALRSEIYATMNDWGLEVLDRLSNRFYQAFVVLSYCRMLHDLHCGQIGSKLAGAEWIICNGLAAEWNGLIERSWARRCSPANWIGLPADPEDLEATKGFVRHIKVLGRAFMEDRG